MKQITQQQQQQQQRVHKRVNKRVNKKVKRESWENSLPKITIYCRAQITKTLLPPQSDFQGKKFLRKNFHPFSGLDGGSS